MERIKKWRILDITEENICTREEGESRIIRGREIGNEKGKEPK